MAGPRAIVNYLRSGGRYAGHNPLGALSVLALLTLLVMQATSGLFSQDDILFEAPFAYWAGDWSGTLTEWHALNWRLLQGLIALHSAGGHLVSVAQKTAADTSHDPRASGL